MRPEPAEVWMVREGDPTATEGTLSIEDAYLRFVPASGDLATVTIPLRDMRKVRRGRASPLLSLIHQETEGAGKLFFFFAKPPPLPGEHPSAQIRIFRTPHGLERSAAALALGANKRLLRRQIDAWVRALRERSERG